VPINGIMLTPWGYLGQDVAVSGGHRNCARGRKSCGFASRGAGPPQVAIGRASGGTPDKPEFSVQPKMRPNEILPESHISVNSLQGEAL
jgi:hypothetical protein